MRPSHDSTRYSLSRTDYALCAVSSCMAAMTAAVALRNNNAGFLFCALILAATAISYSLRNAVKPEENGHSFDIIAFGIGCALCMVLRDPLNQILPEGGYTQNLVQTSALSWMLVIGSLFAWRDSTLLFLAVPGIAIFGLVGAYDTLEQAPYIFFLFIIITAHTFARSNLRSALSWAKKHHRKTANQLESYEWKALAGPEWAVGSALAVIVFSWFGAPFIRQGMSGATAAIGATPVALNQPNAANADGGMASPGETVSIGRGPIGKPSDRMVLSVRIEEPLYLRGRTYDSYSANRWRSTARTTVIRRDGLGFDLAPILDSRELVPHGRVIEYTIRFGRSGARALFLPGEPLSVDIPKDSLSVGDDGNMVTRPGIGQYEQVYGKSLIPSPDIAPVESTPPPNLPENAQNIYSRFGSTAEVRALANSIVKSARTDLEKAELLREAVSQRIVYNLQAPEVPREADPVEHVLFKTQEGYCDLFASSLAQLARAAGLHSRVATGFLVGDDQLVSSQNYQVRDRDYHMWTEIYFDKVGWVVFDATEGAREKPGFGRGSVWKDQADPRLVTLASVLGGSLIIGFGGYFLWKNRRASLRDWKLAFALGRVNPALDGDAVKRAAHREVAQFLHQVERISRVPRRFESTAREYLGSTAVKFNLPTELADGTSQQLESLLYARSGVDIERVARFKNQRKEFVGLLKSAKSAKRRR